MKFRWDMGRLPGLRWSVVKNDASSLGASTGNGLKSIVWTRLKMAVLAPMPSASESTAIRLKALLRSSIRAPYFRSFRRFSIFPDQIENYLELSELQGVGRCVSSDL